MQQENDKTKFTYETPENQMEFIDCIEYLKPVNFKQMYKNTLYLK